MTEPLVTVVVPVYNRNALIGRCLSSIKAQTLRPLRVIVVDNNSTDDTEQVVENWTRLNREEDFKLLLLHENIPGACAARNRGLYAVTTPFTLFFDSDDVMHPELLERALSAIKNNDVVFWKGEVLNADGSRFIKPFHTSKLLNRQIVNSILSTQLYLARTEIFRKAGGWNPEASVWNDWELGIRLLLSTDKVAALPEVLVTIYPQELSITGTGFHNKMGAWEKTIVLARQDILKSGQSKKKKKQLLRLINYKAIVLASSYHKEGFVQDSNKLLHNTLVNLNPIDGAILRLLHNYTNRSGRAAYYFYPPFHQ